MSSPVNTPGLFESMVEALFVERAASQISPQKTDALFCL